MKTTEGSNAKSRALDEMSTLDIVTLMNEEDQTVPQAVKPCLPRIAHAADMIASRLQTGGRVFAAGAGTSGRLAVLDAAELPLHFHLMNISGSALSREIMKLCGSRSKKMKMTGKRSSPSCKHVHFQKRMYSSASRPAV